VSDFEEELRGICEKYNICIEYISVDELDTNASYYYISNE
jgi:hypothetical protein